MRKFAGDATGAGASLREARGLNLWIKAGRRGLPVYDLIDGEQVVDRREGHAPLRADAVEHHAQIAGQARTIRVDFIPVLSGV